MYYSKTLKQFLAGIKPEVKNDADEKKEKELIKRTLLGHKKWTTEKQLHLKLIKLFSKNFNQREKQNLSMTTLTNW